MEQLRFPNAVRDVPMICRVILPSGSSNAKEAIPTLDFSSTRTYVTFSALLRASRICSLTSRTIPFVPSLMFPCFDFACLPHIPTRSYVYRTLRRTYSYIRNSPVYCRLQD